MSIPNMLQIESAAICNAKCEFCPVGQGLERDKGQMSDELFMKIVKEANELSIKKVLLFLNGEPFVFARIFDWFKVLREHGMTTEIFTNGVALTPSKSARLLDFADVVDSVAFSISGCDEQSQMEIMGLDFNKTFQNVRHFIMMNKGRIAYYISMPSIRDNSYQNKWKGVWSPLGRVQVNKLYNWAGDINAEMGGTPKYCGRLNHMTVLWDGRVSLCCMDADGKVILGDLNEQTISEVYNGKIAERYRRLHREGRFDDLDLCKSCNLNRV